MRKQKRVPKSLLNLFGDTQERRESQPAWSLWGTYTIEKRRRTILQLTISCVYGNGSLPSLSAGAASPRLKTPRSYALRAFSNAAFCLELFFGEPLLAFRFLAIPFASLNVICRRMRSQIRNQIPSAPIALLARP
jgi:hypothetical protein